MNAQVEAIETSAQPTNAFYSSSNRFLLNTPREVTFLTMAATETGNRALLGEHERLDPQAGSAVLKAQILLRNSVSDIEALTRDETRSEVEKHEAAGIIASKVTNQLAESKAVVSSRAESLIEAANEQADSYFAPRLERGHLDARIMDWVNEQAKTPEGMTRIRAEAKVDKNLAAILYHSPSYIVGIASPVHAELRYEVMQQHLPAAYKMLSDGVGLQTMAPKFDSVARRVASSFYNAAIAAKVSTRVEI